MRPYGFSCGLSWVISTTFCPSDTRVLPEKLGVVSPTASPLWISGLQCPLNSLRKTTVLETNAEERETRAAQEECDCSFFQREVHRSANLVVS